MQASQNATLCAYDTLTRHHSSGRVYDATQSLEELGPLGPDGVGKARLLHLVNLLEHVVEIDAHLGEGLLHLLHLLLGDAALHQLRQLLLQRGERRRHHRGVHGGRGVPRHGLPHGLVHPIDPEGAELLLEGLLVCALGPLAVVHELNLRPASVEVLLLELDVAVGVGDVTVLLGVGPLGFLEDVKVNLGGDVVLVLVVVEPIRGPLVLVLDVLHQLLGRGPVRPELGGVGELHGLGTRAVDARLVEDGSVNLEVGGARDALAEVVVLLLVDVGEHHVSGPPRSDSPSDAQQPGILRQLLGLDNHRVCPAALHALVVGHLARQEHGLGRLLVGLLSRGRIRRLLGGDRVGGRRGDPDGEGGPQSSERPLDPVPHPHGDAGGPRFASTSGRRPQRRARSREGLSPGRPPSWQNRHMVERRCQGEGGQQQDSHCHGPAEHFV
mmetsp:Transcript_59108/g.145044  ORF Transcript_59108/g.145044 Transcript_59108/m.145044 type:complete len:440 (+) Transcript_59108:178-1497(+)